MNVIKILSLLGFFLVISCGGKDTYRWEIDNEPEIESFEIVDVSKAYFDSSISNANLKSDFPDFFEGSEDSLLNTRRSDTVSNQLHNEVITKYPELEIFRDSLNDIFKRLTYFYPNFKVPTVYTFTGEMPYEYPVAYFPDSRDIVIGPDWFLGKENPSYDVLGIQEYFRSQMNPTNFKPKVVESIARQMVPYDIRKRNFIEKMIYEGKLLIIQDALLPETSDAEKIGYTDEKLAWAFENEAQIYLYFTEEQIFFSDDRRLNERFLEPAPFSKFYSENDTHSPGRIGAWMGWQICRAYLNKNKDISLQEFIMDQDLLKIFKESGYKPVD